MVSGMFLRTRMSVKGQVTIFIALGVAMLFAVTFAIIFLYRSDQGASQQSTQLIEATQNKQLDSYVTSCLDKVVKNELLRIGRTGGLPKKPATGADPQEIYPRAKLSSSSSEYVLYGITQNRQSADSNCPGQKPLRYDPPRYPDWSFDMTDPTQDAGVTLRQGYFGDVNIPGVCEPTGQNAPSSQFNCGYYTAPGTDATWYGPTQNGISIQKDLEQEIFSYLKTCVTDAKFKELGGREMTVNDPKVITTFTLQSVIVNLSYPIQLQGKTGYSSMNFVRTYPVRLMPLIRFAIDIAREDTRDPTFDIADPRQYSAHGIRSYPEFVVAPPSPQAVSGAVAPDASFPGCFAPSLQTSPPDLITITDRRSSLDGNPYVFRFLREHRRAVLAKVSGTIASGTRAGACTDLLAADPDERALICQFIDSINTDPLQAELVAYPESGWDSERASCNFYTKSGGDWSLSQSTSSPCVQPASS